MQRGVSPRLALSIRGPLYPGYNDRVCQSDLPSAYLTVTQDRNGDARNKTLERCASPRR